MSLITPGPASPIVAASSPFTTIGRFPNTTPFTYRDGSTFAEMFEQWCDWVEDTVIPEITDNVNQTIDAYNKAVASLLAAMAEFKEEIAADRAAFEKLVTDKIAEMDAKTAEALRQIAAIRDAAVAARDSSIGAASDSAASAAEAQRWAANTQVLQDGAVSTLIKTSNSLTVDALKAVVTPYFIGLGNVANKSELQMVQSGAIKTALDGKAEKSHTHQAADLYGVVKTIAGAAPDDNGDVAISAIPRAQEVSQAVGLSNLFVLGDSIARGSGANRTAGGFGSRLASASHLDPVNFVNDAASGTVAQDILTNVLGANGYSNANNRPGLAIVHTGINSIINIGPDDAANEVKAFTLAMKNVLRALRGAWTAFDDASIVYTGTWADAVLAIGRVGNKKKTSTNGSYFTITTTASEISVMGVGFSTRSGNGASFSVTVNGAAYVPEITTFAGTASTNNAQTYGSVGFRVVNPSPGSAMSVRVTRTGGVGDMFCDGYISKASAPPMVAMCKIIMPTQAGLNINGAAANRVPGTVDQYNQIIDDISKSVEFLEGGKVVALDVSTNFVNGSMRPGDGIHPNDWGHRVIEENIERWARKQLTVPTRGIQYV